MEWLSTNMEWFFSGIGVFLIGLLFTYFFNKPRNPKQKISSWWSQDITQKSEGNSTTADQKIKSKISRNIEQVRK